MQKVQCKTCGAPLVLRTDATSTTCKFCGATYMLPTYGNTTQSSTTELREERLRTCVAEKLKEKREFRQTLAIFAIVVIFLWLIWLITTPGGHPWPIYPMGGMGVATVAMWSAYNSKYGGTKLNRLREFERELEKERARVKREVAMRDPFDDIPQIHRWQSYLTAILSCHML